MQLTWFDMNAEKAYQPESSELIWCRKNNLRVRNMTFHELILTSSEIHTI